MNVQIDIDREQIAAFCRKWQIREMALFGSALRDDFGPESDIDLLIKFESGADWSLWDHQRMEDELAALLGRKVDLVSHRGLVRSANWIRRQNILESMQVIYEA